MQTITVNTLLTNHAKTRMRSRNISFQIVDLALKFGREIRSRGGVFHVIGKKEITQFQKYEPQLKDMDGFQVLTSEDGVIITVYRNKDLRKIRPCHRKHAYLH